VDVNTNWWEDFFEGPAVTTWLNAIPAEQSRRDADRLKRLLALPPGAEVLDVPCGAGRVAAVLADQGYRVTGVDWSTQFLARARGGAPHLTWERRDMRDLPWPARFDGAFCTGNSFGYLDDEGNAAFVRAVAASLKPAGRFVLDTPMVTENLLHHLQPRPWWKLGDTYLLAANHYDPARSRLDIEYTFVAEGRIETRRGSHRAYSYRELVALLTRSGFAVDVAEPWNRDAQVVTFVATRDSS
jgi:SAM-dependent methyltransferase